MFVVVQHILPTLALNFLKSLLADKPLKMDVLRSLNLEELPEQQTRMAHLVEEHPDFQFKLGFDSCCTCGQPEPTLMCPNCQRVKYCSHNCMQKDTIAFTEADIESDPNQDTAMGHSSIVCTLLQTCNDDEDVEAGNSQNQKARNRIQSEFESYPATLSNAIIDGPVFQSALRSARNLVVHVIGASVDAELWDMQSAEDSERVVDAYADALIELSEKASLDIISLYFVGPDCPDTSIEATRELRSVDKKTGSLLFKTVKAIYDDQVLKENAVPKPDIVVFFNPGFTVPEYNWKDSVQSIPKGTPFLSTTNTEVEGIADTQFLLDLDRIQELPPGLADIFGMYCQEEEESDDRVDGPFFTENPFCGSRVRQSGTMGNDLFVKSRWMLGAVMDSYAPTKAKKESASKRVRTRNGLSDNKEGNPALI